MNAPAPLLFGTDGVRGVAGRYPLTRALVRKLGAAAAAVYREQITNRTPVFLLGRDTRSSGGWIAKAFAQGAATHGVKIRDLGVISTPSLAYLVPERRVLGGVMISASHNPAEFNGIKLFNPHGRKCPDAWERRIEKHVQDIPEVPARSVTMAKDAQALPDYLAFLRRSLVPKTSFKGLTLVVDCSNGSLSTIAPAFLRRLGVRVIVTSASPNGRNINAGCGSQHPEKMRQLVKRHRAHGGIAFDGDADRVVFCDETGELLDGDYLLACAAHFLREEKRLKGNTVVVTVMANLGLLKTLESWHVHTLSTAVGDRWVSEMLEERGCVIGGEQSGHIIFHEFLPTGDGLLTAIQILGMLRRHKRPLSWVRSLFERFPQVLLNVPVREKKPVEDCPAVQAAIQAARRTLGDQGRVFVRYSGTEPLLRIMLEGPDQAQLNALALGIAQEARKVLGAA